MGQGLFFHKLLRKNEPTTFKKKEKKKCDFQNLGTSHSRGLFGEVPAPPLAFSLKRSPCPLSTADTLANTCKCVKHIQLDVLSKSASVFISLSVSTLDAVY